MKEKSISNFDFLLLRVKLSGLPKLPSLLLNILFSHVSLSQKGNFRADSTEKVKEAQRCGVAVVIKYRSGSWKGGWRKIWLCGDLEKVYQNRLFISSASERTRKTIGWIQVGNRYFFPCKAHITLHVEGLNIYRATGQTTCQAQGTEGLPLVQAAPGLWKPEAKGE